MGDISHENGSVTSLPGPDVQRSHKGFRVIIAGGGVTGLTASHMLTKAGIDHIVIERSSEPAPATGASIAIYPHGSRILEQLGLLEELQKLSSPMERLVNRRPDGSEVLENDYWGEIRKNHAYELLFFERREFLQSLYDQLPDKSKIVNGKKVVEVLESHDGVSVLLSDGSREEGDVLIGCDGVHSFVRQNMWDQADTVSPGLISISEKKTMMTSWTCLVGMGPREPALRNELSAVHNEGYSFLIGTQSDRTFFFVFFRVDKPYSQYTRPRWTQKDADDAAARVMDRPVSENVVFGDIWRRRYRATMVDVEEGVLTRWFFNRTVLVGDACHKVTPNIALGGNSGMESMALLTNLLHRTLSAHPNSAKPTRATLTKVFQEYQDRRIPRMRKIVEFSNLITRVQAWDGFAMKATALYVLPYQSRTALGQQIGEVICDAEKLDFVPIKPRPGRIAWKEQKNASDKVIARSKSSSSTSHWNGPVFSGAIAVPSLLFILYKGLHLVYSQ
ncbi:FAD dependent monooxygenase [Microdochium nivale]|nr:FAD dependent monooxygenase [Microdochium nivale]